jgi:hypothetical protein
MTLHPALRGGFLGLCLACAAPVASAGAQQPAAPTPQGGRPNVFWDCQGFNCNDQYYRTEIDWVNWIRVPEESEIHVIMTSQRTGAGGFEYVLDFIGRGAADGRTDQLRVQTLPTDTQREQLDAVTNALALGLARFALELGYTGLARIEGVSEEDPDTPQGLVTNEQVADPWNLWSFRVNANSNIDGEEKEREIRIGGGFSASRVTPTWKLNFFTQLDYEDLEIERNDGSTFTESTMEWEFNPLAVYSVAGNWSVGIQGQSGRRRNENQEFFIQIAPALEYSFFPYDEATRRSLTAFYTIGPSHFDYFERTIEGQAAETRMEESFSLDFSQRQPWGDASIRAEYEHFLHDFGKYRADLFGNVRFRVTRGLSVNARANMAWVENQIYLSAEGVTDEEALLDLRQRATSFEYGGQIGFSFQFGSIFNNVVNNRFPGGGGGGGFGGGGN